MLLPSEKLQKANRTTTTIIIISESLRQALKDHAIKYKPNESCALLFGHEKENKATKVIVVKNVFLTDNTERSPVRFTISNDELIQAYQTAEKKRLEVVGIFHSHPSSEPYPSTTDRKFMYTNPVVWVIFSGASEEFKAFLLQGNGHDNDGNNSSDGSDKNSTIIEIKIETIEKRIQ